MKLLTVHSRVNPKIIFVSALLSFFAYDLLLTLYFPDPEFLGIATNVIIFLVELSYFLMIGVMAGEWMSSVSHERDQERARKFKDIKFDW